ncbi:MAG: PEGA domain-containing protein [Tepidisphaeraceae bacterium]
MKTSVPVSDERLRDLVAIGSARPGSIRGREMRHWSLPCMLIATVLGSGCVHRELTVESDPPGVLVHLNGQEFGRTPVTRDFTWYGTYDVELRKEGYETRQTTGKVIAPWWQWVPLDLFVELLPLTDRRQLHYTLKPAREESADPQRMFQRAQEMRGQLQSTSNTRPPTTAPAPAPEP